MSRTSKDATKSLVKDCSSLDVFGEASMDVARGGMKLRKSWMFDVTPTTLDVQNIEGCNEVVDEGLFIPGCVGEASTIN